MSVYTNIDPSQLEHLLSHYSVGELVDFKGISDGIENTNYFVDTRHQGEIRQFVLTIFEHHSFEELQAFLGLMHHLADHQVPSANPVADDRGQYLRRFGNKPLALVERLKGASITDISIDHCRQLGEAVGKMHAAGLSFDIRIENTRGPHWCRQTASRIMDRLTKPERTMLQDELAFQHENRHAGLPQGITHADLFRDNALWYRHDGQDRFSGIIDFYYACHDVLLYDLAVIANDWCGDGDYRLEHDKVVTLLRHYHAFRPLQAGEQAFWPVLLRSAALRFWLSRLYDKHFPREGELVHTKDPDVFRAILQDRIQHHDDYRTFWIGE